MPSDADPTPEARDTNSTSEAQPAVPTHGERESKPAAEEQFVVSVSIPYEKWRYEITTWIIEESNKGLSDEAVAIRLEERWPENLLGFITWYTKHRWPDVGMPFYEWFVHRARVDYHHWLAPFFTPRKGRPNILNSYALLHLETILSCRPSECSYFGEEVLTIRVIRDLLYRFDGITVQDKTLRRMLKDFGYHWTIESGWTERRYHQNRSTPSVYPVVIDFCRHEKHSMIRLIKQTPPDPSLLMQISTTRPEESSDTSD